MDTEDLENKIELIDKEIFEIFKIVTSEKDISMYKSSLLNTKLQILEENLKIVLTELFKIEAEKADKKVMISHVLSVILFLSFICMFIKPLVGIPLIIASYMQLKKFFRKCSIELDESYEKVNYYDAKSREMNIEIENSRRILNDHTNKYSKIREEINNEELKVIDLDDEKVNINVVDDDLEKLLDLANNNNENSEEMRLTRTKKDKK